MSVSLPAATNECVVAACFASDFVVAAEAADHIVTVGAGEDVVTLGTDDRATIITRLNNRISHIHRHGKWSGWHSSRYCRLPSQ